jgi:hypothetical protein
MGIFYYNKYRLIQFKKYLIFTSINRMDNISFINKDEVNEKINMIMMLLLLVMLVIDAVLK